VTRVRLLVETDQPAVGELLVQAFPDEMRRIVGIETARRAAVMADLTPPSPNHFVADVGERVAGVMLLQDHAVPAPNVDYWSVLRRRLSFLETLRAAVMLLIFDLNRFPRDRLYIDTLAVHPDYQGRGVAGALLRYAITKGQQRGKAALALHVIDQNHHAQAIYEHLGFGVVRTERTWFMAPVLGFWSAHYMELPLSPALCIP